MRIFIFLLGLMMGLESFGAQTFDVGSIYDGQTLKKVDLNSIVSSLPKGTIVVVGELHEFSTVNELAVMSAVSKKFGRVFSGLEFLNYTDQTYVDQFLKREIDEATFKEKAWDNGFGYEYYKFQILFPKAVGGWTYGLNLSRKITNKVMHGGIKSLSAEEKALLPPNFEVGNDLYKERFMETIGGTHGGMPPETMENMFVAQSLWDDTMAWQALGRVRKNPDDILVIVVGDFHVMYGGGLPDRLSKRGAQKIVTFAHADANGLTQQEIADAIKPDPRYGKVADYIWISDTGAPH